MRYVMMISTDQALPYWPGVQIVFWTHVTFLCRFWLLLEVTRILTSSFLQSFFTFKLRSFVSQEWSHTPLPHLFRCPFWMIMWSVLWFPNEIARIIWYFSMWSSYYSRFETCWLRTWHDQMIPWWSHFLTQRCFAFITRWITSNCKLQMSHFRFKS